MRICGQRGDRGVCPLPSDHSGACETVHGKPIHLAVEERKLARYHRILSDLSFFLIFTSEYLKVQDDQSSAR